MEILRKHQLKIGLSISNLKKCLWLILDVQIIIIPKYYIIYNEFISFGVGRGRQAHLPRHACNVFVDNVAREIEFPDFRGV